MFFRFVTKHACNRQKDGQTDGQNYDSQDRASIAASRGKMMYACLCRPFTRQLYQYYIPKLYCRTVIPVNPSSAESVGCKTTGKFSVPFVTSSPEQ